MRWRLVDSCVMERLAPAALCRLLNVSPMTMFEFLPRTAGAGLIAADLPPTVRVLNDLFSLGPRYLQLLRAELCHLASQSKHDCGNPTLSTSFRVT